MQNAKALSREWVRNSRNWDYNKICKLLPDGRSQVNMVKELLLCGFFVANQPQETDAEAVSGPDAAPSSTQEAEVPSGLAPK